MNRYSPAEPIFPVRVRPAVFRNKSRCNICICSFEFIPLVLPETCYQEPLNATIPAKRPLCDVTAFQAFRQDGQEAGRRRRAAQRDTRHLRQPLRRLFPGFYTEIPDIPLYGFWIRPVMPSRFRIQPRRGKQPLGLAGRQPNRVGQVKKGCGCRGKPQLV